MITQQSLKKLLEYNPQTGIFTWRKRAITNQRTSAWNARFAGKIAGTTDPDGYIRIMLEKTPRKAHRLAFLYMTGSWPDEIVDHKNLVRNDNRWKNLRAADHSKNHANAPLRADNRSGFKGVTWNKANKSWQAQIQVDGKRYAKAGFSDPAKAAEHYTFLANKHFGEFART